MIIENNIAIFPVLLPLLAAIISAAVPATGRLILPLAASLCLGMMLMCVPAALDGAVSNYNAGGWPVPVGIALRLDALSIFMLIMVNLSATLIFIYNRDGNAALMALAQAGMNGMLITRDMFNFYVFLEISSLASYVLIAAGHHRQAPVAAFRYLIHGGVAATFYLIGIGILYAATGTLNLDDMAARLPESAAGNAITTAFCLIVVGIGIKSAIFPLHRWLPDSYSSAPDAVSALLASSAGKIGLYALLRVFFELFGAEYSFTNINIGTVFIIIGMTASIMMSITACKQSHLKRLLAYSSLAQTGAIITAIGIGDFMGLQSALIYMAAHTLATGALFMAAGCIYKSTGSVDLKDLNGIASAMPYSTAAITLAGLAVVGIPASTMFTAKWLLLQAALNHEAAIVIVAGIAVSTAISAVYWWQITSTIYRKDRLHTATEAPASMLVPCWVMVLLCYYSGIDTAPMISLAAKAASMLSSGNVNQLAAL